MRTRTLAALTLAIATWTSALAQNVPPQSDLRIWVDADGTRGFRFAIAFPGDTTSEQAEQRTRENLPFMLAEKQWCLNGWTVTSAESVPIDRPKGVVTTLTGVCQPG